MKNPPELFIIDTFALIFRAYYAMINNRLYNSNKFPTSAIFGVTRMLISIIKNYKPDYLVLALDSEAETMRQKKYKEYKANREEPPEEIKIQIPKVIELLKAFKLTTIEMPGYEADDIIATICNKLKNEDIIIKIVSGDKDLLQLVDDKVSMLVPQKGMGSLEEMKSPEVEKKWGVQPLQIIEVLSLMGDASDNIPGVRGIGEKTAISLIQEYKTIDNLYNSLHKISKQKLKENLMRDKESAYMSKDLLALYYDLPVKIDFDAFQKIDLRQDEAIEFLKRYELKQLLFDDLIREPIPMKSKVETNEQQAIDTKIIKPPQEKKISAPTGELFSFDNVVTNDARGDYKAVLTVNELNKIYSAIKAKKIIALDTESTSENVFQAKLIGFSISIEEGKAFYLPLAHKVQSEISTESMMKFLSDICTDKDILKIGQNYKYDYMLLKLNNIHTNSIAFDTMLASYILDPERPKHSMDYLANQLLSYKTIEYSSIVKKGETLLDVNFDTVVQYASEDADITFRLYNYFKPKIDSSISKQLYYEIELPLINVLAEIEMNGVEIDSEYLQKKSIDLEKDLILLEKDIHRHAGETFNINSPKQLQEILFEKLKLPHGRKTKTGYSTDVSVLESLAEKHDVVKLLLDYRTLSKLKSTYLDALPKLVDKKTNRIHTSFNQTITATGRLSSNNPNLQNIPIRDEIGKSIRQAFIAEKEYTYASADYSQIELRILAHISKEPTLVSAYNNDLDIHKQTASLLFNIGLDEVDSEKRNIAKTINFGIIYGMGSSKLAKTIGMSSKDAKVFIENYFEKLPNVKNFIDQAKTEAHQNEYVKTLLDRIRYLPNIRSTSGLERSQAEREAVNTIIQGTSADFIKIAMIAIHNEIKKRELKSKMIIQVHDELVFEIYNDEIEIMKSIIIDKMENAYKLIVPLKVNLSMGKNWSEAH